MFLWSRFANFVSCSYSFNEVTWHRKHVRLNKDSSDVTRFGNFYFDYYSYSFGLGFRLGLGLGLGLRLGLVFLGFITKCLCA